MQQTEKYWNLINRVALGVLLVMVILGIAMAFIPKINQHSTYLKKSQDLQEKIDKTKLAEQKLKIQQHRLVNDPTFVERIAHKIGYAHADETIFHFPKDEESDER
jgi:cell division protein FtsB